MFPDYIDPVFRPPSEADSLILQVTNGCSWNNCSFCEMYTEPQKKFRPKAIADIRQEIEQFAGSGIPVRRVFLADGDAMSLSYKRLYDIMAAINEFLTNIQRVSAYCLPRNLKNKSVDELSQLQSMGLKQVYVGCESGDDLVLEKVKESQPEFLATLVMTLHKGPERYHNAFGGDFIELNQIQLFEEMEILLSSLELNNTVFRSDHASNHLVLKGVLNKDKEKLLKTVSQAIHQPGSVALRPNAHRGF